MKKKKVVKKVKKSKVGVLINSEVFSGVEM